MTTLSTMSVSVHCAICREYVFLEDMLFPHCGHPLCSVCLRGAEFNSNGLFRCPTCRQYMKKGEPHRIYPQFSKNAAQKDASHVASRLKKITVDTPAVSFKKGAQKLRDVADKVVLDPSETQALLDAAQKMDTEMHNMAKQNEVLNQRLEDLTAQLEESSKKKSEFEQAYKVAAEEARQYRACRERNEVLDAHVKDLQASLEYLQQLNRAMQARHVELEEKCRQADRTVRVTHV
ncbi:hypothetical protein CC2G_006250 [Coprinopsis cinerea AmutBmut pab1-1]|nr:hypothetical protein CC2G_006250 [Coprinopsis cinerea AmutBmut pab1-1]